MIETLKDHCISFFRDHLSTVSSRTFDWIAALLLHVSTFPAYTAVIKGVTDTLPNLDIVLFVWTALALMFVRSVIRNDTLNVVTIALGFIMQAVFMAFILFI